MSTAASRASMFGETAAKAAPPPANDGLPPDWVEKKDEKTGKPYYYNKKTRETSWKKPEGAAAASSGSPSSKPGNVASAAAATTATADNSAGLPPDWIEKKDDKTGKVYYYNKRTRETSWKKPEGAATAPTAAAKPTAATANSNDPNALPAGWQEKQDPKTGKTYFYNKETRETSWTRPKGKEEPAKAAETQQQQQPAVPATYDGPPKSVEEALQRGEWIEKSDPSSGRKFYLNVKTKETTWNLAKQLGLVESGGGNDNDDDAEMAAAEAKQQQLKPPPTAKELLETGVWKSVRDYRGLPYFIKPSTGEACADLELYLKIKRELEGGPSAEARKDAAAGIPQMKDWMDVFTRSRESDAAEKRLLDRTTKREVDDARLAVQEAKRAEEAARRQLALRDQEITNLRALLSMQNREVQQLQCALFYGMGGNAYSAAVTQSAASSDFSGRPSKLLLPPPPLDVTIARDENHPENVARRIATLERLVFDLQAQNRNLLEQLRTAEGTKHRHADCAVCVEHDPWQRLLSVAHSPSRQWRE